MFLNFIIDWITLLDVADARRQGVRDDQIVFTDVAMKNEHIRRGALADLFLDTWVFVFFSSFLSPMTNLLREYTCKPIS